MKARIGWVALLACLLTAGVATASVSRVAAGSSTGSPTVAWRDTASRLLDRAGALGHAGSDVGRDGGRGALPAYQAPGRPGAAVPPELVTPYEVVASYPHDPRAFLQGLVWYADGFYESTGLFGESTLRRVAFPSGDVVQSVPLSEQYFGEGLALVGDRLVQLTWRSKKGFVYDRETFGPLTEFAYGTEGWGLTYDGASLIMSDGSNVLTFLDPDTYQPQRTLPVTVEGRPVRELNELEWIGGEVWANVWQTDLIVRIDPATGRVVGILDMTGLLPADWRADADSVLNGIAYDPVGGRIFVSGKRWPLLFEIRLQ